MEGYKLVDNLYWYMITGQFENFQKLFDASVINDITCYGTVLLHDAVNFNRMREFDMLMACENIDVNKKSGTCTSLLYLSVYRRNKYMTDKLIAKNAHAVHQLLHIAVYRNAYDILEDLLDRGLEVDSITPAVPDDGDLIAGHKNLTPLHIACIRGYLPIVALLIYFDANQQILTDDGFTAEQLFMKYHGNSSFARETSIMSAQEAYESVVKLAVEDREN